MPRWIKIAYILLLCGSQSACKSDDAARSKSDADTAPAHHNGSIQLPADSPLRERLRVETVQLSEIERPLLSPGLIEAAAEKLVHILPPVSGRIVRIQRALGDTVKAGDPLFSMDSADLAGNRAEAAKARAAAAQARREMTRMQTLFDAEVSSRRELEEARFALAIADSDAHAAGQRLLQMGAAAEGGRDYLLRSPINGRVIEIGGAQGGYWNDINAPVMTVADLSTLWLSAHVAERDLAQVFNGQRAHIRLNAFPDDPIEGEVRYIGEVLDADTRTVNVRVALDNADGRLRPGMFAQVRLDGRREPALTVPASALLQDATATRVYVEVAPFNYQRRTVVVGASIADRVEIISGLSAGDRVVIKEGALLHD